MKHDQHRPDKQELQMLAHFRAHSPGEPSAELDARILAAANAAAPAAVAGEQPPGWSARLHAWLFGGGRQRWSLALAGVACLGIGVSLTWRTFEQAPDAYDAVPSGAPMAPAASVAPEAAPLSAPMAESAAIAQPQAQARAIAPAAVVQGLSADAAKAEKKASAAAPVELLSEEQANAALHDQLPQAASAPALGTQAKPAAPAVSDAEQQLHDELQRLLKLRRDGWAEEADALLLKLMREHPQLDINEQLKQLEQAQ